MLKKFGSLLTLSSLLLTTTAFAKNPADVSCYDRDDSLAKAAAFSHTTRLGTEEGRWWSDYCRSGEEITSHVERLASTNPQAAMWFLLTGGANGFSDKQATDDQAARLVSAMKRVAQSFLSSRSEEGLETWAHVKASLQAGHVHLHMLNRQVDELQRANDELQRRVDALTVRASTSEVKIADLEARLERTEKERQGLSARLEAAEKKREESERQRLADVKASKEEVRVLLEGGMADLQRRIKDAEAYTTSIRKDAEAHTTSMIKLLGDQIKEFSNIFDKKLLATEDRLKKEAAAREESFKKEAAAREAEVRAREDKRVAELLAIITQNKAEAAAREERKDAEAKRKESRFLRIIAKRLHGHKGGRVPAGRRAAAASEAEVDLGASDASEETLHRLESVLRELDGDSSVSGDGDTDSDTASTTS
jgi:chromosome segregation ATPase